jgi:FADH2 O2-dependent halogenase
MPDQSTGAQWGSLVMSEGDRHFDVAIIGSGIAGSALGTVLARHGLAVVLIEAGSHPRFAVGESMILETSEVLRALAALFDVPELAYFTSEFCVPLIGTSHGVKRHFSFLHHSAGKPQRTTDALQAVIPRQPYGHELHLFRQDSDAFLAVSYGCTLLQRTRVGSISVEASRARLTTTEGTAVTARFVVDAGGFRSILADQLSLRDFGQRTHSRSLFTHMVGVPCFHDVCGDVRQYGIPFRVSEGTLHHLFDGGWLWVIPFNNHPRATNPLCSVGLQLDPRLHPARPELTAEEEFRDVIGRYPDIARQFRGARAVRPWVRTGRLQYASRQVVADRWCLLGHAAGFIDPLFSKGLYTSLMCTSLLAHLLLEAARADDFSAARFEPLERMTQAFGRSNDRLIANAYRTFRDPRLWSAYSTLWLLGAYTELIRLCSIRARAGSRDHYFRMASGLRLVGGGFPAFDAVADTVDTIVESASLETSDDCARAARAIREVMEPVAWMPEHFRAILRGKTSLPATKVRLGLLAGEASFLGTGHFRSHFFGDVSTTGLVTHFVREKVAYSERALLRRKRRLEGRGRPGPWRP